MTTSHTQFIGSIPEKYDEHLGPLFFYFFAEDLANRVAVSPGGRVLELACGTGISTEFLRRALPDNVEILATDLNEPMVDFARAKRRGLKNVVFEQADALQLPCADAQFDAAVCQFGLMFFPDKLAGLREAARILKPGGQLLFNVWDSFAWNPIARVAFETIARFFAEDPPTFLKLPFGYHEIDPIKALLHEAGFADLQINIVRTVSERPSAGHVAEGLVAGNPGVLEIQERGTAPLKQVIDAVTQAVVEEFGDKPMRTPLQAIVFSARR
jgi:ubiquinone/menaquinone biosynthesis C-methylase UbiE